MVMYTSEKLQQRESKDQKVLTGRKLAIEQAVMTTSQHVGVASSIWTNKPRSFAAAWWLSNNSGKNRTKGLMQRITSTGSGKAACRGGGVWQGGWWGTAARCMLTLLPDRTLVLDDSAKNLRLL